MSEKQKYPFTQASKAADYIAALLRPHCNRLHIAGSIRRLRYQVSDIEIVCEPKKEFIQKGLFAENGDWLICRDFSECLAIITDTVIKGNVEGRMMKISTTSKLCPGICLDLFMPQPDDYYRIYAIRTGCKEYAEHVIATSWKKKGWVGVKDLGLRKINECDHHKDGSGKNVYTLRKDIEKPTLPPVWQSEGQFFTWLGLEYNDPEYREFKLLNETK